MILKVTLIFCTGYTGATHEAIVLCKPTEHFEFTYSYTILYVEFLYC